MAALRIGSGGDTVVQYAGPPCTYTYGKVGKGTCGQPGVRCNNLPMAERMPPVSRPEALVDGA